LPLIASFFLGGFAGAASWLPTYPIDYVKTIIQSQRVNKIVYRSMFHCARVKFEEEGIRTFFKGLGVAMLRSFPVNGVGFVSF
jgi:solute carrier family 25 carnitine/acylcarnitine transporter 20/29